MVASCKGLFERLGLGAAIKELYRLSTSMSLTLTEVACLIEIICERGAHVLGGVHRG